MRIFILDKQRYLSIVPAHLEGIDATWLITRSA